MGRCKQVQNKNIVHFETNHRRLNELLYMRCLIWCWVSQRDTRCHSDKTSSHGMLPRNIDTDCAATSYVHISLVI